MINKNKFSIKNTKKVLHKVGKQWVVVSAVLLGLVAGGAAVNETANADTTANASQQEVSQAPSSNASNVAKPASKAVLGATAAPASTARLGGVRGKVANAKTDIKSFYNNGLVTDAENEVNNYIKPSSNASTHAAAATAYNDLINNASANSIESYVNNGAALGSTTDTIANGTWLGEFNQALSDAHAIYSNNPTNPKVAYRLTQLDSLYGTNLSKYSKNISAKDALRALSLPSNGSVSLSYSYPEKSDNGSGSALLSPVYSQFTSAINSEKSSVPELSNSVSLPANVSTDINEINTSLSAMSKANPKLSIPSNLGISTTFSRYKYGDLVSFAPTISGNLNISGNFNVSVKKGTTLGQIIDKGFAPLTISGGQFTGNNISAKLNVKVHTDVVNTIKNQITGSLDRFSKTLTNLTKKGGTIDSTEYKLSTLYNNPTALGFIAKNKGIPASVLKQGIKAKLQLLNPLKNKLIGVQQKINTQSNNINSNINSDLTNTISNKLNSINLTKDVNDKLTLYHTIAQSNPVEHDETLPNLKGLSANKIAGILDNTGIKGNLNASVYDVAINQVVNDKLGSTRAQKIAAVLRAANEVVNTPAMKTDYDNILSDLKELPTVNENKAANNLAKNSNNLANEFQNNRKKLNPESNYNQKIVNFLRNVAKNATNGKNNTVTPPKEVADVIDFIDSKDNKVVGSFTTGQGKPNTSFKVKLDKHLSKDYKLTNPKDATVILNYDGATHDFNVTKVANPQPQPAPTPTPTPNPQPQPTPQPSNPTNTNTNKGTYVPQVASSSSANSSMASSSASASVAPASVDVNDLPPVIVNGKSENEKHAAKYAQVVKALQLHTNPNFTKKNAVAVVKPNTTFKIEKSVKAHNGALRYEVKYNKKNYFITANKHFVNAYYKAAKHANHSVKNYVHYRYAKVIKSLWLHTNAKFTKRNGVKRVKPNTEFHINNIVKNHGLVRYEVRHNHKNYFITASHHYTVNAYVQKYNFRKHGYKGVRVLKPINEYRKLSFAKRSLIRHFYRGSVLPVKKVVTIASGEMTRLQLTNGHYVTANKDFVEPIR